MIHYHGCPITPRSVLLQLAGRNFCVSSADRRDTAMVHQIGQSVMLDNGAFTAWRSSIPNDWTTYYEWVHKWLEYRTTWAVIPDVIGGSESDNDHLINEWFANVGNFKQAAPVWHLHESLDRLERLSRGFNRVCFGSSGEFATIGSNSWNNRMNEAFNRICKGFGSPPCWIHMLRGMSLSGSIYPFASVDSTDIARNHHVKGNPAEMADRWDRVQNPARWTQAAIQQELTDLKWEVTC